MTTEYETRDALNHLFDGELTEDVIESLAEELDQEATSWLHREEWASIDQ